MDSNRGEGRLELEGRVQRLEVRGVGGAEHVHKLSIRNWDVLDFVRVKEKSNFVRDVDIIWGKVAQGGKLAA